MNEIFIFFGTGAAGEESPEGYPLGERHPVLLFLRQAAGSEPDFAAATEEFEKRGWRDIDLTKASPARDQHDDMPPQLADSLRDAKEHGFAAVVFSDPVSE